MAEELKKNGYQPSKTNIKKPIPPSSGSNVKAKKNGYTWEDVDKAWWEGFDYCKEKLEKQIEKMKCCQNCKNMDFSEPNYCMKGVYRERQYVCSKWELAE